MTEPTTTPAPDKSPSSVGTCSNCQHWSPYAAKTGGGSCFAAIKPDVDWGFQIHSYSWEMVTEAKFFCAAWTASEEKGQR